MNKFTKAIAAIMLMMVAVSCNKPDEPTDNSGTLNGHDYVDLGLPSGTLWATCNVGADAPEGYGNYFAWGETEPKEVYTWDTYKYCNGGSRQMTKYCTDAIYGFEGFTDGLTVLQLSDDAAAANWGDGWSMPTLEQWNELIDNTTNLWKTINGKAGRLFTGSNGNSIFIPAAYNHNYGGQKDPPVDLPYANYWSSSLYDLSSDAWSLNFYEDCGEMADCARFVGQSVRPVLIAK